MMLLLGSFSPLNQCVHFAVFSAHTQTNKHSYCETLQGLQALYDVYRGFHVCIFIKDLLLFMLLGGLGGLLSLVDYSLFSFVKFFYVLE